MTTSLPPAAVFTAAVQHLRTTGRETDTVLALMLERIAADALPCRCTPETCATQAALVVARRILGTNGQADTEAAPAVDRAAVLNENERTMLAYALDQAQEHIWSRDGFTDEDQAAVTSLRRLAAEAQPPAPEDTELTAQEARNLADELGASLYQAQDALAFVGECCDLADREQRTITTADVREWVKGARCGRQFAADAAAEAQQPVSAEAEAPLSPYYSHEACGFHWHGRDGMDIPMRDGQPVCPRCELRRMADEAQQPAGLCGHCGHPADWHDEYEGCVGPNGIGGIGSGDCTCTRRPGQADEAQQPTPGPAEETKPPGGFATRVCRNCSRTITWVSDGSWTHEPHNRDGGHTAVPYPLPDECHRPAHATEEPTR